MVVVVCIGDTEVKSKYQPLVNIRRSTASAAQISHHNSFTAGGYRRLPLLDLLAFNAPKLNFLPLSSLSTRFSRSKPDCVDPRFSGFAEFIMVNQFLVLVRKLFYLLARFYFTDHHLISTCTWCCLFLFVEYRVTSSELVYMILFYF